MSTKAKAVAEAPPKPARATKPRAAVIAPVPALPTRTTGLVLNDLKKHLALLAEQPWHTVARLKPANDAPDAPFVVSVVTPTGPEWVGQYTVDVSDEELLGIAEEVVTIWRDLQKAPARAVSSEDGESDGSQYVGKRVTILKANGESVDVIPQRRIPARSETQERRDLEVLLDSFPTVTFFAEVGMQVWWNEFTAEIVSGENVVKKPFFDVYVETRRQDQMNRRAMNSFANVSGQVAMPTYQGPAQ